MIKVGEKIPDIEAFHEEHPGKVPSKLGTKKTLKVALELVGKI